LGNKIVIFTSEYPYGQQETFIENELAVLSKIFPRIVIVPLFKHLKQRKIPFDNIEVFTPVNKSRKVSIYKVVLLASITFWKALFMGFIDCKFNPLCLVKAIKQAFIISRLKKYLIKRPELFNSKLWYFYWGTNSVNVLPFLNEMPISIARYHRYDLYGKEIPGGELQLFQEKTLNKLNQAFCISEDGREYLRNKYNQYSHKLNVSRLGVNFLGLNAIANDGVFRIVTCSNIYAVKRVHLLAQALKEVLDIHIEWTHIGDGPQAFKAMVESEASQFPPNIKFNFLGRIPNKQIMDYYLEVPIDLFVNVSVSEGVPVSIMEALSFGVPVIATNVGGTSELVNEKCGFLIDPFFEITELRELIKSFYRKHYGDLDLRARAHLRWKEMASAEVNYGEFVEKLKIMDKNINKNKPSFLYKNV
jgi:colanic acid/amylovoran biosynthesis glycosyltransferase